MATTTKSRRAQAPQKPEYKIGPFHNGLGVAVWLNSVETENGVRYFRSITVAKRRFRDPQTGEWKDAVSYRPVDLTTLMLAFREARDYCLRTPLPGQPVEGEEEQELHAEESSQPNGQVPF